MLKFYNMVLDILSFVFQDVLEQISHQLEPDEIEEDYFR